MSLVRIQLLSLITKAVTISLSILQAIIVVRVLSTGEYGLAGLVLSIGSVVGVSQHLGIVDGAIREIAVRSRKDHIGKIFWVSHIARQVITIPLSLLLMLLAQPIASGIYERPEIAPYIIIFALTLVLQGFQDVLGAVLTGMKKFKPLYLIQIATAIFNILVFGVLTMQYQIAGFFWAMVFTTTFMVLLLSALARHYLVGYLAFPSWSELMQYGKHIMRVGVYMYVARILFVVWQRLPILLLGAALTDEQLGFLNVSLKFGSQMTIVAMALSEVNLSWMSSVFAQDRREFIRSVTIAMKRIFFLMTLLVIVLLYFTPEILQVFAGTQYLHAIPLITVSTAAFFLYTLSDIGTSSVLVAANNPRGRAVTFSVMIVITLIPMLIIIGYRPDSYLAMWAAFAGALGGFVTFLILAIRTQRVRMINTSMIFILVMLGASVILLLAYPHIIIRIFFASLLIIYVLNAGRRDGLIPRDLLEIRKFLLPTPKYGTRTSILCFAGAEFNQPTWTNRQQIMTRVSHTYPVLYVEGRVWIARHILRNLHRPRSLLKFIKRILWYDRINDEFYVVSQWNLLPGSRESHVVSLFNHALNRWWVLLKARLIFGNLNMIIWIYDTEAREYLSAFKQNIVVYDCVDNHEAQAGADRNVHRVQTEEQAILSRANLVTVTSEKLYSLKKRFNANTHLVLNAGDVDLYRRHVGTIHEQLPDQLKNVHTPILGAVGALDSYKFDFELLLRVAQQHSQWSFVFIGSPAVERKKTVLQRLSHLSNVHILGTIERTDVPKYVYHFDACLIPYRKSPYNDASFPLKFWEFMATGLPIVVTGLPELKKYAPEICYAESYEEFIECIEHVLMNPSKQSDERINRALEHSWDHRTNKLLSLLGELL